MNTPSIELVVTPLPFLRRLDNALLQAVRVRCIDPDQPTPSPWVLNVQRGSWNKSFPINGVEDAVIFMPEAETALETIFTAARGESRTTRTVRIKPVRRWTIHLVLHSHTDLGFTDPVSDVARLHCENTDRAIEFCRETAHLPEGVRFKWTCEVTWQVQNYLRDRRPEQVAQLMDLVRNETMAIGAMYSGEFTEMLGHEEAVRCFAYAGYLRRQYGVPCDTAMLCDVPGCTAGFIQIMAKSGIRSLIIADNNFMAPFLPRTDLPRPFVWTGADQSEVLCWFTDHPFYAYVEGEHYGFLEDRQTVEKMLGEKLLSLEHQGYPYDRFQIQYAFDNAPIKFVPAQIVREWTEQWEYPRILLSTAREFLGSIRRDSFARLPRRSGDWTDWWGGIVTGFPAEEMLCRQYHLVTPAVETLSATLSLRTPGAPLPDPRIARAYDGLLAFDEHSGSGVIWQPKSRADQDRALREGFGFLHSAIAEVDAVQREALDVLSARAAPPGLQPYVGIYNPSGVFVSREVDVSSETGTPVHIRARHVPPYGYKLFPCNEAPAPLRSEGDDVRVTALQDRLRISTPSCAMEIDTITGRWTSFRDGATTEEYVAQGAALNSPAVYLVRPVHPFELGRYIPELYDGTSHPGDFLPWPPASRALVSWDKTPAGAVRCRVEHSVDGSPWLSQEYYLSADVPGISITTTLLRTCVSNPGLRDTLRGFLHPGGMLYICFPFALANAMFEYESTGSILQPPADQFRGSCLDFLAIQRWCALRGPRNNILVTVLDTPLMDPGSVGLHKFKTQSDADPSALFFRAVTLQDWGSADESPYTRDRDLVFRYNICIIPTEPGADPAASFRMNAHRQAVQCTTPLLIFTPAGHQSTEVHEAEHRYISVTPENVELMTFKPAESGQGWIVRLREVTGVASTAQISFPGYHIRSCHSAMMTEEKESASPHSKTEIVVSFVPFAIRTLLVELEPQRPHAR